MRTIATAIVCTLSLWMCSKSDDDRPPPPHPPQATLAPNSITVAATSTPAGAAVTGGGQFLGTTPLTAQVPVAPSPPGTPAPVFAFTFSLGGYQPATVNATPVNGAVTVMAALSPIAVQPLAVGTQQPQQPLGLTRTPAQPSEHPCLGQWSGPLAQSNGPHGSGDVHLNNTTSSCGGFVEHWNDGNRCDYHLSNCSVSGDTIRANGRGAGCTNVRVRFACQGSQMRFFEDDSTVTVSSTMSRR